VFPITDRIYAILSKDQCGMLLDSFKNRQEDLVLISINDPDCSFELDDNFLQEKVYDFIKLYFWDTDPSSPSYPSINQEQAKSLLEFILKYKDKKFLIHCEAGISRSSAIAHAIHCILDFGGDIHAWSSNVPDSLSYKNGFYPNRHVFLTLVDVYNKCFQST